MIIKRVLKNSPGEIGGLMVGDEIFEIKFPDGKKAGTIAVYNFEIRILRIGLQNIRTS